MRASSISFITIRVFTIAISIFPCGSKQKTDKTTPGAGDNASASGKSGTLPKVTSTEKATGELRDVLLHLRRVHFAYDTDTLLPESRTALEEAAEGLNAHPDVHVYIDGHTDNRGTTEYNLALGDRRARTVSSYLQRLGVSGDRLHIVTFGKEQLMDTNDTDVANAKNRRAEFRVMRGSVHLILDEGQLYDDSGENMADNE